MNVRVNTLGKNIFYSMSAIILFVLFIVVAFLTIGQQGIDFDEAVGTWAAEHTSSLFESVMKLISIIGSSEVVVLATGLIGLILLIKRKWKSFFMFFVLSLGGVVLNFVTKLIVQRARPGDEAKMLEVFNIEFEIQSYSFPSGHTMRAVVLFLFIAYLAVHYLRNNLAKTIITLASLAFIVLVAWSRVVLDAHYATDIIGGLFMAGAWYFFCLLLFNRPKKMTDTIYLHRR